MINKPLPFKGLNIRILSIVPIKGRRVIGHGFTLACSSPAGRVIGRVLSQFGVLSPTNLQVGLRICTWVLGLESGTLRAWMFKS